jgi:hypothetical protein
MRERPSLYVVRREGFEPPTRCSSTNRHIRPDISRSYVARFLHGSEAKFGIDHGRQLRLVVKEASCREADASRKASWASPWPPVPPGRLLPAS